MPFSEFLYLLVRQPKTFFSQHASYEYTPYFPLVFVVFALSQGIGRADKNLTRYELSDQGDLLDMSTNLSSYGTGNSFDQLNHWTPYWGSAAIGGLVAGAIAFYVGGWFYNKRVKWANGTPHTETSRVIFMYSGLIPAALLIGFTLLDTFTQAKPRIPNENAWVKQLIILSVMLPALYHSVYISYLGVTATMAPSKKGARFWFLILPITTYTLYLLMGIAVALFLPEV